MISLYHFQLGNENFILPIYVRLINTEDMFSLPIEPSRSRCTEAKQVVPSESQAACLQIEPEEKDGKDQPVVYKSTLEEEEQQNGASAPAQDTRPACESSRVDAADGSATSAVRESSAEPSIVPGAASGANVIAIEMPECPGEAQQERPCNKR